MDRSIKSVLQILEFSKNVTNKTTIKYKNLQKITKYNIYLLLTSIFESILWFPSYRIVQRRPFKMRSLILYLANSWMDSKMLLTPNIFYIW